MLQQLNGYFFHFWGSCHLSGKSCNIAATQHASFLKGMGSKTLACEWNKDNSKGNAAGTLRAFKQLSLGSNNPNEKHLVYLLWVLAKIFSIQILPAFRCLPHPLPLIRLTWKTNFAMKVNNAQMTEKCLNSIETSTLLSLGKCNQSLYLNFLTILQQSKHLHFNRD